MSDKLAGFVWPDHDQPGDGPLRCRDLCGCDHTRLGRTRAGPPCPLQPVANRDARPPQERSRAHYERETILVFTQGRQSANRSAIATRAHVRLRWRRPPACTAGLAHVPSTDHLPLPLRGEVGGTADPIDRPIRWSSDGRRAAPPGRRSRTDCSARQSDRAVAGPSSSRGRPGRLTRLLRAAAKLNPISPRILKRRLPP